MRLILLALVFILFMYGCLGPSEVDQQDQYIEQPTSNEETNTATNNPPSNNVPLSTPLISKSFTDSIVPKSIEGYTLEEIKLSTNSFGTEYILYSVLNNSCTQDDKQVQCPSDDEKFYSIRYYYIENTDSKFKYEIVLKFYKLSKACFQVSDDEKFQYKGRTACYFYDGGRYHHYIQLTDQITLETVVPARFEDEGLELMNKVVDSLNIN